MLEMNRKISPEEELSMLVLEILRLEDNVDRFSSTLKVLLHNHKNIIEKGNFSLASELLKSLHDIHQSFSPGSPENANLIDSYFHDARDRVHLDSIKKVLVDKKFSDYAAFFRYIEILRPKPLFLAEMYEEIKSPEFRSQMVDYLKNVGKKDFSALLELAHESRVSLTKEIISILSSTEERRAIVLLANFISYRNTAIKEAVIESLGKVEDSAATKILLSFMADEDEHLRISAARNLRFFKDKSSMRMVIQTVQDKTFIKKSMDEKQALLDTLAKIQTEEALQAMQEIISGAGFFSSHKRLESSLCAIKALEKSGVPESVNMLKRATKSGRKAVRKAARSALQKLSAS
jgi:HEAT repeat protein